MHYFQFNIGDYASHTKGLSLLEDLAYRRLMDQYYLDEKPLEGSAKDVARVIGMRDHQEEVDYVLERFFELVDGGWVHDRIEEELEHYKEKSRKAAEAGKASAKSRAKKNEGSTNDEQTLNGRSTDAQPTNNQEPITNNQQPPAGAEAPGSGGRVEYQRIADLYNEILGGDLGKVRSVSPERKKHLKARISEDAKRQELNWWETYFAVVRDMPFLMGNGPPKADTGKPWKADFDWLINPNNLTKVIEGKYENDR